MSGSGRRRSSKWDLREDNDPENLRDGTRSSRGDSFHDRQSRESLSGRRGFHRNESIQDETMVGWDKDRSHAARLSPDGQIRRNRSRSPRSSRARSYRSPSRSRSKSRSRSPARNFRREPEFDDQYRGRSGISAQVCREYAAGRCRRGSSCSFLHDGSLNVGSRRHAESNATDSWEGRHRKDGASRYSSDGWRDHVVSEKPALLCKDFVKGNCRWGASCRFSHQDAANDFSVKLAARDVCRDGDYEQGSRDEYSSRRYDHEPSKSSNIICKYFSAGNCRSGKNCRFSHHGQEAVDPEKSVTESYNNMGSANQVWNGPKWSDKESVVDVRLQGWGEGNSKKMDAADSATAGWSGNGSSNQNFADNDQAWGAATGGDTTANYRKHLSSQWKMDTAVSGIGVSETKGSEKYHNDIGKQGPGYNVESKAPLSHPYFSGELGVTQEAAAQAAVPKGFDDSCLGQNHTLGDHTGTIYEGQEDNAAGGRASSILNFNASSSILPAEAIYQEGQILNAPRSASLTATGQIQSTFPSHPAQVPISHNQSVHDGNPNNGEYNGNVYETQVPSGPAPGQSNVLSDQLAQFSQLSTTLAQLLENTQKHRPQQFAAIPSVTVMDSGITSSSSMGPVPPLPVVSSLPIYTAESTKQYDPICDSFESKVPEVSSQLSKDVQQSSSVHQALDIETLPVVPASSVNGTQMNVDNSQTVGIPVHVENGGTVAKGKSEPRESGPVQDIAAADDGNKAKETKEIRPFKFALAEFVKELLNPSWKEGNVSREAFKTIVKKVVEKVVDAMQVAHIPQSKEKIDHYLSDSKPKLSKLVQAYVEKFQKA